MEEEHSREFLERKCLIEMDRENITLKHKFKMEELEFERATSKMNHEMILERGRIQRAEERKLIVQKYQMRK